MQQPMKPRPRAAQFKPHSPGGEPRPSARAVHTRLWLLGHGVPHPGPSHSAKTMFIDWPQTRAMSGSALGTQRRFWSRPSNSQGSRPQRSPTSPAGRLARASLQRVCSSTAPMLQGLSLRGASLAICNLPAMHACPRRESLSLGAAGAGAAPLQQDQSRKERARQ